jgi:hypothetical protein
VSVFLATYFETNGYFDSNVKLFPVIYANYRPMTDDRRQTETLRVGQVVCSLIASFRQVICSLMGRFIHDTSLFMDMFRQDISLFMDNVRQFVCSLISRFRQVVVDGYV